MSWLVVVAMLCLDGNASVDEGALFGGGDTTTESDPEERLDSAVTARTASTDLGGQLYLRLEYQAKEDGRGDEMPLVSPSLFDVYLDGRPNEHVRAYARGRLLYDVTVGEDSVDVFGQPRERSQALLDQLWLKFDIAQTVFVTAGQQPLRWGVGRFWNPTDFLNAQVRDPLAVFDERVGVSLVKLHLPFEALGWNLYAVANIENAETPEEVGGALRGEFLFGETEISLSAAARKDAPLQLGIDFSSGVWLFDLKGEAAFLHGVETDFYRGNFTPSLLALELPTAYSRKDDWIVQAVAGAELGVRYSEEDTAYFGVEYFYNDAGYDSRALYLWLLGKEIYRPLYVGRHYLAAYTLWQDPGPFNDTRLILSGMSNLSDESYLSRFDYQLDVIANLAINAFATYHFGRKGELHFGASVPPIEGIEAFDPEDLGIDPALFELAQRGLTITPPLFEAGIGLRVAL